MDDQQTAWRHSERKHQWEFGYYDLPRQKWIVRSFVTDEFIANVHEDSKPGLAMRLRGLGRFGASSLAGVPAPRTAAVQFLGDTPQGNVPH